jgi:hypothetical protein
MRLKQMDSPCKLPTMKLTATFAILAAFFTTLASAGVHQENQM